MKTTDIRRLYDYTVQHLLSSMLTSCHAIQGEQWQLGLGRTITHTSHPVAVSGTGAELAVCCLVSGCSCGLLSESQPR